MALQEVIVPLIDKSIRFSFGLGSQDFVARNQIIEIQRDNSNHSK